MPELPEVEVVKESLSRTITGKKIKKVSIKNRNLRYKIKKGFETRLQSKSIKKVKRFSRGNQFVFEQQNNPQKPMSENTMLYAMYRMGYHGRATVHGFRATASTILNEKGFRSDVIELLLAHVEKNQVRAAYNRAEYLDERREILQWWADHLDEINPL